MCITKVGKVLSVSRGRAEVEFFGMEDVGDVDVSVVGGVSKGAFVEVFGDLALSVLSPAEAKRRKAVWEEVRNAAIMPSVRKGARP
ncbi:MAG TPA: HypC/HybG/HupF family hydrogenase formation chaperone [Nitrososphaerales archaeon]|nr:HypC/HybG/HupF family hydrogenase formation chaperone [Nitrososphaerales archaeon]